MPNSEPKTKTKPKPTVVYEIKATLLPGDESSTPWVFEINDRETGETLFRPEFERKDRKTGKLVKVPARRFANRHAAERTAGRYIERFKKTGRFE